MTSRFKFSLLSIVLLALLLPVLDATGGKKEPRGRMNAMEAFTKLPPSVLEMIGKSQRLDMLDYYAADSIAHVRNAHGGESYLISADSTKVEVQVTPASKLSVMVLPWRSSQLIATCYTIGDSIEAQDSWLRFFDTDFREIPSTKFIPLPQIEDFFNVSGKERKKLEKDIDTYVPFPVFLMEFPSSEPVLSISLEIKKLISKEEYDKIAPALKDEIQYRWTGSKFKRL